MQRCVSMRLTELSYPLVRRQLWESLTLAACESECGVSAVMLPAESMTNHCTKKCPTVCGLPQSRTSEFFLELPEARAVYRKAQML
jgi:hypothetical protein